MACARLALAVHRLDFRRRFVGRRLPMDGWATGNGKPGRPFAPLKKHGAKLIEDGDIEIGILRD